MSLIDMAINNIVQDNLLMGERAKVKLLRVALSDMARIVEAFGYTTQLGKTQKERLENARRVLKETAP